MHINDRGLYDIYAMYHVPFWQTNAFFWAILIIIAAGTCGIIALFLKYYWFRRKRIITPWQKALTLLDALVVAESLLPDDIKHYYFAMTDIMKIYIGERYRWDVTYLTDKEFVEFIVKSSLDSVSQKALCTVFNDATMIKFADQKTALSLLKDHIDSMRGVIYATIPHTKNIKTNNSR
jgi:hypothetical protein